MNFLAHLHLADHSMTSPLGNLLGDFVKGPLSDDLDADLRLGILLHRAIDRFTDSHEQHRAAVALFMPPWRRYGPILVDLIYDHFLCLHWARFCAEPQPEWLERHYRALLLAKPYHPHHLAHGMPLALRRMAEQDWLGSYIDKHALAAALDGIGRRLRRPQPLSRALTTLTASDWSEMEKGFLRFYPQLMAFAGQEATRLGAAFTERDLF